MNIRRLYVSKPIKTKNPESRKSGLCPRSLSLVSGRLSLYGQLAKKYGVFHRHGNFPNLILLIGKSHHLHFTPCIQRIAQYTSMLCTVSVPISFTMAEDVSSWDFQDRRKHSFAFKANARNISSALIQGGSNVMQYRDITGFVLRYLCFPKEGMHAATDAQKEGMHRASHPQTPIVRQMMPVRHWAQTREERHPVMPILWRIKNRKELGDSQKRMYQFCNGYVKRNFVNIAVAVSVNEIGRKNSIHAYDYGSHYVVKNGRFIFRNRLESISSNIEKISSHRRITNSERIRLVSSVYPRSNIGEFQHSEIVPARRAGIDVLKTKSTEEKTAFMFVPTEKGFDTNLSMISASVLRYKVSRKMTEPIFTAPKSLIASYLASSGEHRKNYEIHRRRYVSQSLHNRFTMAFRTLVTATIPKDKMRDLHLRQSKNARSRSFDIVPMRNTSLMNSGRSTVYAMAYKIPQYFPKIKNADFVSYLHRTDTFQSFYQRISREHPARNPSSLREHPARNPSSLFENIRLYNIKTYASRSLARRFIQRQSSPQRSIFSLHRPLFMAGMERGKSTTEILKREYSITLATRRIGEIERRTQSIGKIDRKSTGIEYPTVNAASIAFRNNTTKAESTLILRNSQKIFQLRSSVSQTRYGRDSETRWARRTDSPMIPKNPGRISESAVARQWEHIERIERQIQQMKEESLQQNRSNLQAESTITPVARQIIDQIDRLQGKRVQIKRIRIGKMD